jgi:arsenate reductase
MEIWHNPRCSKSRAALALLQDAGADPEVRRYLDDPPSAAELRRVLGLLGMQPWDLVRAGEGAYREQSMGDWPRTDAEVDRWIQAMVAHPALLQRPVVIEGDRAVVGRPPQDVQTLLS